MLDGGAGRDAVSYRSSDAGVTVSLKDGTASGGHAENGGQKDTIRNFERVHGSNHADSLTGGDSGPAAHNELLGRGGADDKDTDQLDLSALAETLTFIEDRAFTSAPGQVRYAHGTSGSEAEASEHTDVEVDVSGNGSADFVVRLLGDHHDLAAGDFILS